MLDKLVVHIPFKNEFLLSDSYNEIEYIPLKNLPENMIYSGDVQIKNGIKFVSSLKTKYESLKSNYSGMAFKVFDTGTKNYFPYVSLKCSPCKLLQGHNLYGFDDLEKSFLNMIWLLCFIYPKFRDILDVENTLVSELDITYSIFIDKPHVKLAFLDYLKNISNGHTKSQGDNYKTTVYFGSKKSRIKGLKCYSKIEEMKLDAIKMQKNGFQNSSDIMNDLIKTDYCKNSVRFEATIKKRFLTKNGYSDNIINLINDIKIDKNFYNYLFNKAWEDIMSTFQKDEINIVNDDDIYNLILVKFETVTKSGRVSLVKVNRLFYQYKTLMHMGYEYCKKDSSKTTFNRNISDLISCGFSKSHLQNLHNDNCATVLPIAHIVNIDFSNQFPHNYVESKNLWELSVV